MKYLKKFESISDIQTNIEDCFIDLIDTGFDVKVNKLEYGHLSGCYNISIIKPGHNTHDNLETGLQDNGNYRYVAHFQGNITTKISFSGSDVSECLSFSLPYIFDELNIRVRFIDVIEDDKLHLGRWIYSDDSFYKKSELRKEFWKSDSLSKKLNEFKYIKQINIQLRYNSKTK